MVPKIYRLHLTQPQVAAILESVAARPWREVAGLMEHIQAQVKEQDAPLSRQQIDAMVDKSDQTPSGAPAPAEDELKREAA